MDSYYYIPAEIFHHIFFVGNINSMIGISRTVCKRFADIFKHTRILPRRRLQKGYPILRSYVEDTRLERSMFLIDKINKEFFNRTYRHNILSCLPEYLSNYSKIYKNINIYVIIENRYTYAYQGWPYIKLKIEQDDSFYIFHNLFGFKSKTKCYYNNKTGFIQYDNVRTLY